MAAKVGGGPTAVLEGLGPAMHHARNARMRQEAARCLGRLASGALAPGAWHCGIGLNYIPLPPLVSLFAPPPPPKQQHPPSALDAEERRLLLEALAALALDASPDVAAAAQTGLTHLFAQAATAAASDGDGAMESLSQELEALGLPAAQLRQLAAGSTAAAVEGGPGEAAPPASEVAWSEAAAAPAAAATTAPSRRGAAALAAGRNNEKEGASKRKPYDDDDDDDA